ncbi:nucleotide-diphospho-sugar transferase [Lizonia empirigonia]|nr:nucleotide-diphospho-sugar transferase [Lizonia empirigonia]
MLVSNISTVLRLLLIPLMLIIYCIFVQFRGHSNASPYMLPPSTNQPQTKSKFGPTVEGFWKDLAAALENARPQCSPVQVEDGHPTNSETTFEPLKPLKQPPERLVGFGPDQETVLLKAHLHMRIAVQQLASRLAFSRGESGIVTTANAKYMPILLVSLRMLRRTGCQLPVEVFIDDWSKYDPIICESVLPSLNATCVILSEVYDKVSHVQPLSGYQFKLFAILFSSFQHVLFLDSDAFPAHDPTDLFSTPPYTIHGLIVWPDLFGLTISEHFYHIAAIPYESPSARAATESGIVLLDKAKHRESLLMMVYYNYHGPDFYYPLLCQGSHGAGDKETLIQAAMAVGAPWYQVKTGVAGLGYFEDGSYRLSGLAQMHPQTDFQYKPPSRSHMHPEDRWQDAEAGTARALSRPPRPLFVHQNMHKLDPKRILDMPGSNAKTNAGNNTRLWGAVKGVVNMFGYDVERRVWEVVLEEGCRVKEDVESCAGLREYFAEVFGLVDSIDE